MKDTKESEENVGFIYYINNYGPDDWRWLTPDFLWDYFFTRESDVRSFSAEAKSAYQHFMAKREYIADDYQQGAKASSGAAGRADGGVPSCCSCPDYRNRRCFC